LKVYFWDDFGMGARDEALEVFGEVLPDEEFDALTAEELRDLIANYELVVVRRPDGRLDMYDPMSKEYELDEA